MKIAERIFLIIYGICFILLTTPIPGKYFYFWSVSFILSGIYLFGGYKLFKGNNQKSILIPILAGIAFACAIPSIYYKISAYQDQLYLLLPIPNILFFTGLASYMFLNRKNKELDYKHRISILLRSGIIFIISSFFAYGSIKSPIYRAVMLPLNTGRDHIISNIKMFHYNDITKKYLEQGLCDKAIDASLQGFEEGMNWLGIKDSILASYHHLEMLKIQGTYTHVYDAYKCKASIYFNKKDYKNALYFYNKADSFLTINPIEIKEYWHKERSESKNVIGLCYYYLSNYDSANINYLDAITYYHKNVENKNNIDIASYHFNLSKSISNQNGFMEANQILERTIPFLKADSLSKESKEELSKIYFEMARNGLYAEDFNIVQHSLSNTLNYIDKVSKFFCDYKLYEGILFYKRDQFAASLESTRNAAECYKSNSSSDKNLMGGPHIILSEVYMSLANYDSAKFHLDKALTIIENKYSANSIEYQEYRNKLASYYFNIGDFRRSKSLYQESLKFLIPNLESNDRRFLDVYASLALISAEEIKLDLANEYIEKCYKIMILEDMFKYPSSSYFINKIAYIKYFNGELKLADSLYHYAIQLNLKSLEDSTLLVAASLNGLGNIEFSKRNIKKAARLYDQSLKLHRDFLTDDHPHTAIVYMNMGELKLYEKQWEASKLYLQKSLGIFQKFYKSGSHPDIADNYRILGALSTAKKDFQEANRYFKQSLEIYQEHFDEDHEKIIMLKKALSTI